MQVAYNSDLEFISETMRRVTEEDLDLQREAPGRQDPQAPRHRIERTEIEIRPVLIRFTPVEERHFCLPRPAVTHRPLPGRK